MNYILHQTKNASQLLGKSNLFPCKRKEQEVLRVLPVIVSQLSKLMIYASKC